MSFSLPGQYPVAVELLVALSCFHNSPEVYLRGNWFAVEVRIPLLAQLETACFPAPAAPAFHFWPALQMNQAAL